MRAITVLLAASALVAPIVLIHQTEVGCPPPSDGSFTICNLSRCPCYETVAVGFDTTDELYVWLRQNKSCWERNRLRVFGAKLPECKEVEVTVPRPPEKRIESRWEEK